jgi:hypothetical protein
VCERERERERKRERERQEKGKKKRILIVPGMLTDVTESVFIEKLPSEVPLFLQKQEKLGGGGLTGSEDSETSNTNIMKNKPHLQTASTYLYFMECVLGILTGF